MNFTELSLNETLLQGITEAGYETCTPVQEQVLSGAFEGADLYVQSQTGTGKTAAYLITIFQQVLKNKELHGKKALILVPTRELAVQVEEEAVKLGAHTGLTCASFYGGVGYDKQKKQLAKGVDIIIGTPGRVIDLTESKTMELSNVGFLVIDEADRMFDMGFYPDLRTLLAFLPQSSNRQTMLFSATLNTYVKNLAWEYTLDAKEITIEAENITVSEIDQMLYHVASDEKMQLLLGIFAKEKPESTIIFCNTKRSSEIVAKRLCINGIKAEFIIGDLPQSKRLSLIDNFKAGKITCLVATDVAARGIDVNELAMVINFDLPNEAENYVHRIGRTARAGKSGKAFTFCSEQDVYNLPAIERYIEMSIPATVADASLLCEDKSAGMYIKTGRYFEEERFTKERPRNSKYGAKRTSAQGYKTHEHGEHNGYSGRSGRYNKDGANYSKAQRDYNGKRQNYNGQKPYNAQKSQQAQNAYNAQNAADLASLSFEERMKVYKERYAGGTENKANDYKGKNYNTRSKSKHQGKAYNANGAYNANSKNDVRGAQGANGVNGARATSTNAPTTPKKAGIFAKIKAIFSSKKS